MYKNKELEIQKEKEKSQKYLEIAGVILLVIDSNQKVSLINKKGCEVLGYDQQEIIGKNWFDNFFPARIKNEVRGIFNKLMEGKIEPVEYVEGIVLTKSGEERIISWHNTIIKDKEDNIISALSSGEDITEKKKAEAELEKHRYHLEELIEKRTAQLEVANKQLQQEITDRKVAEELQKESEIRYSILVENARDGVILIKNGLLEFINKAMAQITGYTIKELKGKSLMDIIVPESRELAAQRYELSHLNKNPPSVYEGKIQCKDGMIKDVEVSTSYIQYNNKPSLMAIVRDMTEHKKLEEELQKDEKIESLGILAGGIAHDFNNLLTTITGNLSLAELYIKPNTHIFKLLKAVERASQQASHLTHQLLTFSRGGLPIKKSLSISKLLKEDVNFALSGSNVRCEFFIPNDLWWAEIDESQITQAIDNLIINANQAMPEGGLIEVCAENVIVKPEDNLPLKKGKYVKILVKDYGIGIKEGYLQKIFDPFFTTKEKGSGLGLAITYSIIKKHSGNITVESQEGIGTTFYIYLPALEREIFEIKKVEGEKLYPAKWKILFMDDQESIRDMVGEMLMTLGYTVEFAKEGDEAIELYKNAKELGQPFDAVVLDLTVPGGMGGEEANEKIHEIDPDVKAIVSSGYSNDPVMSDCKHYGFSGVVEKPYEIQKLSETLCEVIKGTEETIGSKK